MTDCVFCHQTVALYEQDLDENLNHTACRAESLKRCNEGMCVKCGEDRAGGKDLVCPDCETNDLDYKGYGGPQ